MTTEQREYWRPKEGFHKIRFVPSHTLFKMHMRNWKFFKDKNHQYRCPLQSHEANEEWNKMLRDIGGESG